MSMLYSTCWRGHCQCSCERATTHRKSCAGSPVRSRWRLTCSSKATMVLMSTSPRYWVRQSRTSPWTTNNTLSLKARSSRRASLRTSVHSCSHRTWAPSRSGCTNSSARLPTKRPDIAPWYCRRWLPSLELFRWAFDGCWQLFSEMSRRSRAIRMPS